VTFYWPINILESGLFPDRFCFRAVGVSSIFAVSINDEEGHCRFSISFKFSPQPKSRLFSARFLPQGHTCGGDHLPHRSPNVDQDPPICLIHILLFRLRCKPPVIKVHPGLWIFSLFFLSPPGRVSSQALVENFLLFALRFSHKTEVVFYLDRFFGRSFGAGLLLGHILNKFTGPLLNGERAYSSSLPLRGMGRGRLAPIIF